MTSKRTYTTRDTKLLWGRSGGKCAYPNCRQSLVEIGPNVLLGEIAHIVAASPNGPRGDASYPQDRLNAYENLILLCPTHHRKIDDQNYIETADELRNWKNAHEAWVDQKLKEGEPWESNIQPYYYNIPKLGILAAQCQMMIDTDTLNQHRNLIDFGFELYKPLIQLHQLLKRIKPHAIPLLKIEDFSDDLVGSLISFEGGFRTKGIPGPHKSS
ncbi:MAG: HNH endonuclease signature motif containing protein, partial [Candidatus Promineifilaceae bacterium]